MTSLSFLEQPSYPLRRESHNARFPFPRASPRFRPRKVAVLIGSYSALKKGWERKSSDFIRAYRRLARIKATDSLSAIR
jgi:hypothetical protein